MDHSHLQPKVDNGDFGVLRATGARGVWIKLKAPDDGGHGGHDRDGYDVEGHDLDGHGHNGHLHQNSVASFTL